MNNETHTHTLYNRTFELFRFFLTLYLYSLQHFAGNISSVKTPQLVILTFDDSLNDLNKKLYESIFHPIRRNPNGCPISATFYVSHEWTDYSHVQNVYSDGHEIASHSISHSFGEQFSVKKWTREMAGQREILAAYGGVSIDDIRNCQCAF